MGENFCLNLDFLFIHLRTGDHQLHPPGKDLRQLQCIENTILEKLESNGGLLLHELEAFFGQSDLLTDGRKGFSPAHSI